MSSKAVRITPPSSGTSGPATSSSSSGATAISLPSGVAPPFIPGRITSSGGIAPVSGGPGLAATSKVVSSSDWITNKTIKLPYLEDDVGTAEFRNWMVKFEKFLRFNKIYHIWSSSFDDRPEVSDGVSSQFDEDQWLELDELVGQLLGDSVTRNKIADGFITQTVNDPWRKTWSKIHQHFVPTGNNATATQSVRVCSLYRQQHENYRMFIKRLDQEYALLLSLGGVQEDYILNELLLGAADSEYKPLIILGIDSKESYDTVRDKLLRAMPHPPATSRKDKKDEARANNSIGPSNSKSGGKKGSKTKNTIKSLNSKFPNPYEDREKCARCKNYDHNAKVCKANVNKKCSYCQKYGHVVSECRTANRESGQNKGTTVANSIPPNFSSVQTSAGQMYMVDASTYHTYMAQSLANNSNSSNVSNSTFVVSGPQSDPKTSIRTVTFPPNVVSRTNGTG
jgi:hypothetical protein